MVDLSKHNGSDPDFYRQIGRLEQRVDEHGEKLEMINDKLDALIEQSNKIKGGWVTLSFLVTTAALLGEFSHTVFEFIKRVFS
jgi:hypothetical protein